MREHDADMLCADYASHIDRQEQVGKTYLERDVWLRMRVLNVARMGKFSSDRAIREYCDHIWKIAPVMID